jgi:DNA (cytosine-5)-methyltransferase 1
MGHSGALANSGGQVAVCTTEGVTHALRAEGFDASEDGTGRGQPIVAFHENQRAEVTICDIAGTLKAKGGKPGQGYPAAMIDNRVRRLTPRECERLQGFPDDYTLVPDWNGWRKMDATESPASCQAAGLEIRQAKKSKRWYVRDVDSPRYKALGNSKAIPVVRWIGMRIKR